MARKPVSKAPMTSPERTEGENIARKPVQKAVMPAAEDSKAAPQKQDVNGMKWAPKAVPVKAVPAEKKQVTADSLEKKLLADPEMVKTPAH